MGIGFVNGVKTGSVSSGEEVDVGYKPQYIYLSATPSTGTNTYSSIHIDIILCYSDSVCFVTKTNNTIGSSATAVYTHSPKDISAYITLTDTGFISLEDYSTYTIVY